MSIIHVNMEGNTTMKNNAILAVEAHGLVKTFGDKRAVDGVSLSIPTGSICGVLGPNGAGKTTTINMLATLSKPDAGNVKIFGYDVLRETQKEKNKKAIAYKLLEKVGIDRETADRKVLKLSGGEQQRVGIARALAHNPDIIIADEPTGNLDTDTENAILGILTELAHKENKCVIIVTHSKEVSSAADEIWGIQKGQIQFAGNGNK